MATLGIDLSRLTVADLRRLREVAERRGETELTEELAAALAARRGPGQALAVRIDDPLAPGWRPHVQAEVAAAPAPAWRWPAVAVAALAVALAAAGVGWRLGRPGVPPERIHAPAPPAPPAPSPPPLAPAVLEPRPLTVRAAPAKVGPGHGPAARQAAKKQATASPRAAAAPPAQAPCPIGDGMADRIVCDDPGLAAQHEAMLAAYAQAQEAGASRLAVDAGQAAWRAVRGRARDPQTLAGLYRRRIAELEAAAREARRAN